MRTLTNKQFCAQLRKAKVIAMREYPSQWCISNACREAGIQISTVSTFDKGGKWQNVSFIWVRYIAKSKEDIAALFDNSIRDLGEEP